MTIEEIEQEIYHKKKELFSIKQQEAELNELAGGDIEKYVSNDAQNPEIHFYSLKRTYMEKMEQIDIFVLINEINTKLNGNQVLDHLHLTFAKCLMNFDYFFIKFRYLLIFYYIYHLQLQKCLSGRLQQIDMEFSESIQS